MSKHISSYKRKRTEEVNELVSYYKQHRSFANRNQTASSSGLGSLNSINLTPWDYNLEANIVIKTEKDLALDVRDFDFNIDHDQPGQDISQKEFFDWLTMERIKTGDRNSVSFASMMTDANSYEEQYMSLKIFLAACNLTYKRELSGILFPVFVHFYLDLIAKPDFSSAQSFFNKFHHDHEEQHKELSNSLQKITTPDQLLLHSNVKEYRECKLSLKLSPPVYLYFLQHLRHGNYTLVLQALNRHFSMKTSNVTTINRCGDDAGELDNDEEIFAQHSSKGSAAEKQAINNLKESISAFQTCSKLFKPSICLYSFINAYHGLTSASFSSNNSMIAGGFEDSSVRLWNIVAKSKIEAKDDCTVERKSTDISPSSKEYRVFRGHSATVYQTEFLMEDKFMLSASQDKSVRLWNVNTNKCLVAYRGHNYSVWDTSVSPHGHYFTSASMDRTVRLWNMEFAFPLRIFAGHNDSVDCVCFHPNSNYIASGSADRTCRLWDLQTGQFVRVLVGHKAPIHALAFTKDGRFLLSAGEDRNILVWDLSNGQLLNEINGHTKTIYTLSFSSDGTMLASGGLDNSVKVWESESLLKKGNSSLLRSKQETIGNYSTKMNSILNLKFSTGNLLLAAGLADGT